MPLPDIYLEGLARDVALKRASEASAPPSFLTAGMAVDRYTGALRVLRSGRDGSLTQAPGPDYGRDMGDPLVLFDIPVMVAGLLNLDSALFDTHRWDWMLVTVQSDLSNAITVPATLQVFALASLLTIDLVFSHPLNGEHAIQTFVVPVNHITHMIRVLLPPGYATHELYVSVERLPPGYPTGSGQPQQCILASAAMTAQDYLLTEFFDRSARGFILNAAVLSVANPTTRVASLEIRPYTGNAGVPMWNVPLGIRAPVHTVARVPQQGPVCIWWHTTGAVGPAWEVTVDFTSIYAA